MGLKIYVGGQFVDEDDAKVSVFDHGHPQPVGREDGNGDGRGRRPDSEVRARGEL